MVVVFLPPPILCGRVVGINSYIYFLSFSEDITTVKTEPNIRIRIRGTIIRIQITETRIRTIIRITTEQGT